MAKKKTDALIEEAVVEEIASENATEEITNIADDKTVDKDSSNDNSDQFVYTQLKVINKINNPAKARRLAERVLRNRKR